MKPLDKAKDGLSGNATARRLAAAEAKAAGPKPKPKAKPKKKTRTFKAGSVSADFWGD
jgi:hypothetical protein